MANSWDDEWDDEWRKEAEERWSDNTPIERNPKVLADFVKGKPGYIRMYGVYTATTWNDIGGEAVYEGENFDDAMEAMNNSRYSTDGIQYIDISEKEYARDDFWEKIGEEGKGVPTRVTDEWYKERYNIQTVGEWNKLWDV